MEDVADVDIESIQGDAGSGLCKSSDADAVERRLRSQLHFTQTVVHVEPC